MPTIKFRARTVDGLKPPENGRIEYWDEDTKGLGLRVAESGRKTWVVMYRHQVRLRRLTLGTYPNLSLADARDKARDELRSVAKGQDPAGDKQASRQAETFGELADLYIEKYAKPNKKSWFKDQQALNNHLLPAFRNRRATDIKRREVIELLEDIRDGGAPVQANRTLEIIRRLYNWGIEREIVEVNPCTRIKPVSNEKPREKVLSDDEIQKLWRAIELQPFLMGASYKMRLISAQRGGEITSMRKADVDLGAGWWTIPGGRSKNGLAHRVPLSGMAVDLLNVVFQKYPESEWVFPSATSSGPIWSIWKATDRIRKASGVEFVPHDMRRTVASKMTGELGINRLTVSKILNHVESGVTAIYDRHSYDGEKRQALDSWAARLAEILSGETKLDNVVSMPTTK